MAESNESKNEVGRLAKLWDFNTSDTEGEEHIRLPPVYIKETPRTWPRQEWINEEAQGLHRVVRTVRGFRETHLPKDRYIILKLAIQGAVKVLAYYRTKLVTASYDRKKPTPLPLRLLGLRKGDLLRKTSGGLGFLQRKLWKIHRKLKPSD